MSYCTLQEAYNVPSFAKKKKSMMPLNKGMLQCGVDQSAADAQPYDSATGLDGKGEYPMYVNQQNAYKPQVSPGPPSKGSQTIEGFMCPSDDPSAAAPGSCVRSSTGFPKYNTNDGNMYASQANDYAYYCKYYNICANTPPKTDGLLEGFQQQQPQQQPQCSPLQAPMYEIPISDAAKKQYEAAMQVAMQDTIPSSTIARPAAMRQVDMSKVNGLYDDEIEQYMQIDLANKVHALRAAATNVPTPLPDNQDKNAAAAFNPADSTPFARAMANFSQGEGRPVIHPEANVNQSIKGNADAANGANGANKWQYITDLLMFIIAGILVIALCEVLFKIALSIGMRDTVNILEPYLKELASLRSKIAEAEKA